MKSILKLTLSTIILFSLISCEKKAEASQLNGTWELRHVAGIQVAGVNPDFKAGNGNTYKFEGETFEKYSDGKKVDSGTFVLAPEQDVPVNNTKANYSIIFNKGEKQLANLSGKTLVLFNGIIAADGTESTFEKQ